MHGLDSNVLLRFLLQDDPKQFEAARRLLAKCTREEPAYVNVIVLCELVWVLAAGAKRSRGEIAEMIRLLLETPEIRFEREDIVRAAIPPYEGGNADLADILIGLLNRTAGCASTHTFDREASRTGGLRLLT